MIDSRAMTSAAAPSMPAQVRRNLVALISLFLALASLAYNTWRNEATEAHRNTRQAAFKTLEVLEELQVIIDARRYQGDRMRGDYVAGWSRVNLVSDLGNLLPTPMAVASEDLRAAWQANFEKWYADADPEAEAQISNAIGEARKHTLSILLALR